MPSPTSRLGHSPSSQSSGASSANGSSNNTGTRHPSPPSTVRFRGGYVMSIVGANGYGAHQFIPRSPSSAHSPAPLRRPIPKGLTADRVHHHHHHHHAHSADVRHSHHHHAHHHHGGAGGSEEPRYDAGTHYGGQQPGGVTQRRRQGRIGRLDSSASQALEDLFTQRPTTGGADAGTEGTSSSSDEEGASASRQQGHSGRGDHSRGDHGHRRPDGHRPSRHQQHQPGHHKPSHHGHQRPDPSTQGAHGGGHESEGSHSSEGSDTSTLLRLEQLRQYLDAQEGGAGRPPHGSHGPRGPRPQSDPHGQGLQPPGFPPPPPPAETGRPAQAGRPQPTRPAPPPPLGMGPLSSLAARGVGLQASLFVVNRPPQGVQSEESGRPHGPLTQYTVDPIGPQGAGGRDPQGAAGGVEQPIVSSTGQRLGERDDTLPPGYREHAELQQAPGRGRPDRYGEGDRHREGPDHGRGPQRGERHGVGQGHNNHGYDTDSDTEGGYDRQRPSHGRERPGRADRHGADRHRGDRHHHGGSFDRNDPFRGKAKQKTDRGGHRPEPTRGLRKPAFDPTGPLGKGAYYYKGDDGCRYCAGNDGNYYVKHRSGLWHPVPENGLLTGKEWTDADSDGGGPGTTESRRDRKGRDHHRRPPADTSSSSSSSSSSDSDSDWAPPRHQPHNPRGGRDGHGGDRHGDRAGRGDGRRHGGGAPYGPEDYATVGPRRGQRDDRGEPSAGRGYGDDYGAPVDPQGEPEAVWPPEGPRGGRREPVYASVGEFGEPGNGVDNNAPPPHHQAGLPEDREAHRQRPVEGASGSNGTEKERPLGNDDTAPTDGGKKKKKDKKDKKEKTDKDKHGHKDKKDKDKADKAGEGSSWFQRAFGRGKTGKHDKADKADKSKTGKGDKTDKTGKGKTDDGDTVSRSKFYVTGGHGRGVDNRGYDTDSDTDSGGYTDNVDLSAHIEAARGLGMAAAGAAGEDIELGAVSGAGRGRAPDAVNEPAEYGSNLRSELAEAERADAEAQQAVDEARATHGRNWSPLKVAGAAVVALAVMVALAGVIYAIVRAVTGGFEGGDITGTPTPEGGGGEGGSGASSISDIMSDMNGTDSHGFTKR